MSEELEPMREQVTGSGDTTGGTLEKDKNIMKSMVKNTNAFLMFPLCNFMTDSREKPWGKTASSPPQPDEENQN